jgi:oligopeptide transport system ATP-binding protein
MNPLLAINHLSVVFDTDQGPVQAVTDISFQVFPGEAVGIVGESGCGKSVTAHSILQLVPTPPGRYTSGHIWFAGSDLLQKTEAELEKIRGNAISMIFQDPMTALNPVLTIGEQIAETLMVHQHLDRQAAWQKAGELLQLVGIPAARQRLKDYPHQFSGGMRQRVMIAIALSCNPQLLIADEPTTALDVTIQAQILDLLKELQTKLDTAIILISHDLGAIAQLCSRVMVMYAGKIVEAGSAAAIYHQPQHPYTWGLLKSLPRLNMRPQERLATIAGQPPDLLQPPDGCRFHPRCPHAMRICAEQAPDVTQLADGHQVFCWLQHPDAPKITPEDGAHA